MFGLRNPKFWNSFPWKNQVQKLLVVFPWNVHGGDCGSSQQRKTLPETNTERKPLKINSCMICLFGAWPGLFSRGEVLVSGSVYTYKRYQQDEFVLILAQLVELGWVHKTFAFYAWKQNLVQKIMLPLCVCWITWMYNRRPKIPVDFNKTWTMWMPPFGRSLIVETHPHNRDVLFSSIVWLIWRQFCEQNNKMMFAWSKMIQTPIGHLRIDRIVHLNTFKPKPSETSLVFAH